MSKPAAGAVSRSRRSRARTCGPARPPRPAAAARAGTATPIVSPIACATSRPTKSSSAIGPIGTPGAERHAAIDVGRGDAGLGHQLDRAEQVREQQPVDDEPRACRVPPRRSCRAPRRARGARSRDLGLGLRREHELDQLHPRHRVEHVQTDEPLGAAAGLGQLGDRERRRRRRQDRLGVGRRAPSSASSGCLVVRILDDRLDDERLAVQRRPARWRPVTRLAASGSPSLSHSLATAAVARSRRGCPSAPRGRRPRGARRWQRGRRRSCRRPRWRVFLASDLLVGGRAGRRSRSAAGPGPYST